MKSKIIKSFFSVILLVTFSFGLVNVQASTQTSAQGGVQSGITITKTERGFQDGYSYYLDNSSSTTGTSMTLNSGGTFSCQWSSGNVTFARGLSLLGTKLERKTYSQLGDITCTYNADYQVKNGSSYLYFCIYSNDAFYYIVESCSNWNPVAHATKKGTATIDGDTYDIYEQITDTGTKTIKEYFSMRTSKRTSGTISVTKHFAAWESLEMQTGVINECSLEVGAFSGSGSCNVTGNTITVGQSSTPVSTGQPATDASPTDTAIDDTESIEIPLDSSADEQTDTQLVLTAVSELGHVKLDWNSIPEVKGYYVYKSTTPGRQSNTPETDFCIAGETYNDTKVKSGIKYYYIVRPVNEDNSIGLASNEVSAGLGKMLRTDFKEVSEPWGRSGTIELTVGNSKMEANGITKEVDPGNRTAPVVVNGRVFLPVNGIVKEMGGSSAWNSKEQKVSMVLNGNTVEMWIGKTTFTVNNVKKTMDVSPWLSKTGRPMLPLRFAADNLGCTLSWEGGSEQIVTIDY